MSPRTGILAGGNFIIDHEVALAPVRQRLSARINGARGGRCLDSREVHADRRSLAELAADLDMPSILLHDSAHDGCS